LSTLQLTKTKMMQGVWQGVLTGAGSEPPQIEVTHHDKPVSGVSLEENKKTGFWVLSVPIPPDAIADGIQTLLILNKTDAAQIGHITLLAGEALGDDIRAEIDLLRAELDLLKRAFRRHCVETQ
tara:strand:+ start:1414 stop:1785 length:372 start_codon:yes stop_codon:yes gene_type:complete